MSRLELLQKFIENKIKSDAALSPSQICKSAFNGGNEFSSTNGIQIQIGIPIPTKVSKYSAGTMFSEVVFAVKVTKKNISNSAPSIVAVCEHICRLLNNWEIPAESGYGKIHLSETSPWKIEKNDSNESVVNINFQAQSLLQ